MRNRSKPIRSDRPNDALIEGFQRAQRWIKPVAHEYLSGHQSSSLSPGERAGVRASVNTISSRVVNLFLLLQVFVCLASTASAQENSTTTPPVHSDLTLLQCGNLIYAGNKSSVCFADNFLTDVTQQTNLRVNPSFCTVRLDSDALFDFPFCVMSGNETFSFTQKERDQLRKYLLQGGFLLASPGCSDEKWDKAFRQEIKTCFPEYALKPIPMTHPIFSIVNRDR